MDPPTATSIEDAMRPAFEELSRRSTVVRGGVEEQVHFEQSSSGLSLPYRFDDQQWALVTMGTQVLAPRPLNPVEPTFRVYGTFATSTEAHEHAEHVRTLDATCSLMVCSVHEWILFPQTIAQRDDRATNATTVAAKLETWSAVREQQRAAFDEARANLLPGHVSSMEQSEDDATVQDAEKSLYPPPRRLRAGGEVRGQTYVTLHMIDDPDHGECLVRILACFESLDDAEVWTRNVGSRNDTEHDIHIAPTCEWLQPNKCHVRKTNYRIPELQKIMDAAERNPVAVRNYREWKREQDALRQNDTTSTTPKSITDAS